MTEEQFRIILELALTKLIELPPATLKSYEPWLTRKSIRWCLAHHREWKYEDAAAVADRAFIRDCAALLRRGTPDDAQGDPA